MGVLHDYGKLLIEEAGGSDLTSDMDSLGVDDHGHLLGRHRRDRR